MLEGRLRRSMVEVHLDNRIWLTALTSPGLVPGDLFSVGVGVPFLCCFFPAPYKYETRVLLYQNVE
jgi:hypothetical protein